MSTGSPFAPSGTPSTGILGGVGSAQSPQQQYQQRSEQPQRAGFWSSLFGATGTQGSLFDRMGTWLQSSIENSADFLRRYVNQYPPLAAYLFTLMALSAIPVSMYAVFAFISSAVLVTIAVIGFTIIEGTILLASGGLLLTVLGTITFFTTLAFGFIGFVWLGYRAFSGVFGSVWQGASSITQKISEGMPGMTSMPGGLGGGGGTTGSTGYGSR